MLRASPVLHGGSSRCAKYAVAEGSQFSGLLVARESPGPSIFWWVAVLFNLFPDADESRFPTYVARGAG